MIERHRGDSMPNVGPHAFDARIPLFRRNKSCGHAEVGGRRENVTVLTEEIDNTIQQNAQGPAKAGADGVTVEQHPLPDQIAADKYLESKKASRVKGLGIKLVKLSPGGAI